MNGSVILDDIGAERAVNEYGVIRESVGEFITAFGVALPTFAWFGT